MKKNEFTDGLEQQKVGHFYWGLQLDSLWKRADDLNDVNVMSAT